MPELADGIELRSEEIQEMLGRTPSWMTRWGATLVLLVIVTFTLLSWFIKYPDVLSGPVVLTTENPPITLHAQTSGKIRKLFYSNAARVEQGKLIAEIENPVGIESIQYLKTLPLIVHQHLEDGAPLPAAAEFTFGDAQNEYNQLLEYLQDHHSLINDHYYIEKTRSLKEKIRLYRQMVDVNENQERLFAKLLVNARNKFETDQQLLAQKVYSKMEYQREEDVLIGRLMESENLKKTILEAKITINECEKQLKDLQFENQEKERHYRLQIEKTLKALDNFTKSWQQNNVIAAPIAGVIAHVKPFSENEYVKMDEPMFTIIPPSENYVAYANISVVGAGKIYPGQKVRIKFDHFPYQQYGNVMATVGSISLMPQKNAEGINQYRVTIKLDNSLYTTYKKKIPFRPDMTGTAEIITEDLRLAERVFLNMRKLFNS